MRKTHRIFIVVATVLLLSVASLLVFRNADRVQSPEVGFRGERINSVQPQNANQRFNTLKTAHVESVQLDRHVMHINSIAMGETIKDHLREDPSVQLIRANQKNESHYNQKEVTVSFKRPLNEQEILSIQKEINGIVLKNLDTTIMFRSNTMSTSQLIEYFNQKELVDFAEPNYLYMQNVVESPNDFLYTEQYQWNLPVIQAEAGWDRTQGNENIVIAVVDTGVDMNHPDLKNRLTQGYNVLENNHHPDDDNGHGTHVAGIIASETNNHEGVAGITWYNKIMPVKAMEAGGYGTTFDIAKGIVWAVDHGADVINLSLGNYQPSALMKKAVDYAYKNNVVLIAAAGNDNTDQPSFPAAYPEVIGVSAINFNGTRAPFSNYGDYIDVAAPGVQIPSTYFNQQYAALSGTSMASPHVSGLAGLILSANPNLKNKEVIKIIKKSAYDLGERGTDPEFGHGLIDIQQALKSIK
jgi:thermitase